MVAFIQSHEMGNLQQWRIESLEDCEKEENGNAQKDHVRDPCFDGNILILTVSVSYNGGDIASKLFAQQPLGVIM